MNKIKNFMNKPITWGGYCKMCGISMGISIAVLVAELYAFGLDPLCIKGKFNKNKNEIEADENDFEY